MPARQRAGRVLLRGRRHRGGQSVSSRAASPRAPATSPYKNPYGDQRQVRERAAPPSVGPTSPRQDRARRFKRACADGYCFQNGEPITVWRNPTYTPAFDAAYRYRLSPMSASGKSIDVASGSTNNGTAVQQWATLNGDCAEVHHPAERSNWKIAMKANTNKCVGPVRTTARRTSRRWRSRTATAATRRRGPSRRTRTPARSCSRTSPSNRCLDVPGGSTADGAAHADLRLLWRQQPEVQAVLVVLRPRLIGSLPAKR